jgi:dTDP-4-dehydrorhamnose reductase
LLNRLLILGSSGMLGSTLTKYLSQEGNEVLEASRSGTTTNSSSATVKFDVTKDNVEKLFAEYEFDYVVNAIGMIAQLINPEKYSDRDLAIRINALFPLKLAMLAEKYNRKLIQIGTDCVFSGAEGKYSELSPLNPVDSYGYSKALGEFCSQQVMLIRCSIIGRELATRNSLTEWVLTQNENSEIQGFSNHIWNGITTLHFAKIVNGIVKEGTFRNGIHHLVPSNSISKESLIKILANSFGRKDLIIMPHLTPVGRDRTLITIDPKFNQDLWKHAGYIIVPTIEQLVLEYAAWASGDTAN